MRSVVTGGAGFIGSHLVEHLLELGDEVVVLDDMSTGAPRNLIDALADPHLTIVHGSVLDRETVSSSVRGADRVFHLAAAVGVKLIVDQPLASLRTNIHGTESVLDACVEHGAALLVVSTSEIYGKNTADALNEESDRIMGSPLRSRWSYAAAKGIDESFAHAYWRELGLDVTIVRLFNTVGPRQTGRYGMVVPNLVAQALRGDPLTVYGDGEQTRCFGYVGHVIPALVKLIEEPTATGDAFNLGGAEEVSINDLARRIIAVTRSASGIVHVDYADAYAEGFEDMRRRVPDFGKAKRLVGFDPTTPLEEIIRQVAAEMIRRGTLAAVPAAPAVLGEHLREAVR